jgi:hypothetical protein
MEIRGNSESAFQIMICAAVGIAELIEDGPEAFAQRAREMLEAELRPLRSTGRSAELLFLPRGLEMFLATESEVSD